MCVCPGGGRGRERERERGKKKEGEGVEKKEGAKRHSLKKKMGERRDNSLQELASCRKKENNSLWKNKSFEEKEQRTPSFLLA